MKPYYEHAGITIYHGDCREVIPTLGTFDLLLTDPPYGVSGGNSHNKTRDKNEYLRTSGWDDTPGYIEHVVIPVVRQAVATAERAIVTPGNRHMLLYPQPSDIGCMWTPSSPGRGPWGFNTFSPIFYYGKDPRAGTGALPSGRAVTSRSGVDGHPCAKPLGFWSWLLVKGSVSNTDIVFDPFVGSGTTLRAAKDLGRRAIGVEIEERYCEIAAKRLSQEVLPF